MPTDCSVGLLAFFAVSFLALGVALQVVPGIDNSSRQYAVGTLLKIGLVLGLAWIAAPQLERFGWQRLRGSMLAAIVVVLVLYAIRPKIGAMAGAIVIAGSLLFSLIGWFRRLSGPLR
jgi:hypothetical protein